MTIGRRCSFSAYDTQMMCSSILCAGALAKEYIYGIWKLRVDFGLLISVPNSTTFFKDVNSD